MTDNYFLDINVIQPLPPNNVNRDDTGTPKTAVYGGVTRARISSQALKRAVREQFQQRHLPENELGRPTREVEALLTEAIKAKNSDVDAEALAKELWKAIKTTKAKENANSDEGDGKKSYLVFFSNKQVEALVDLAIGSQDAIDKKEARRVAAEANGLELALFGRMIADAPEINVDAAVQVAHGISTHAVELESDYFTAVDQFVDDPGAAMIGDIGFSSSTMYRYAAINLGELMTNLGDPQAVQQATDAFVRSFIMSMPSGKQNTFANITVPDAVLVVLRKGRPLSLAGAFERPVTAGSESGYVAASCSELAQYDKQLQENFVGAPVASFVVRTDNAGEELDAVADRVTLDELMNKLGEVLPSVVGEQA
ncbi:type I-E CRISPR-associated protein Cas7/Cse4/CasC [Propionibacterium freudenreichii]|uniref:type I-E CRISPR-associated protein Cas7/Cse4/CasC n=1 Tax=Propionibacterium freudenreichii TaxID=1744 RepID=UPI002485811A|nr:type I-E CRISPR-associated protein Cas7/Cse4/CasC [Propionibacterium freudenreichii]WGU89891.1 type I-E CRISPR-associated protein Cas7/Cse4/CasC [Propionibacterium freudenreichii]